MRDREPYDEYGETDSCYDRAWRIVHGEDDPQKLEECVLHNPDVLMRAFAFCRLTGWAHWERNDSYSNLTYACGHVEGFPDERALRLCHQIQDELGYEHFGMESPMTPYDVLREDALMVSELIEYGQNFCQSTSYVRQVAQQEAASLDVAQEGIEFWLLSILRFAQLEGSDLRNADFPFSPVADAEDDVKRCRALLKRQRINAHRLEPILRGVLAAGAESDRSLLTSYFAAAKPQSKWVDYPFEAADLLRVILAYPTEAICLAMTRLALIMTLEARLPQELRAVRKTPYRPFLFQDDYTIETADLSMVDISCTDSLSGMFAGCSSLRSVDLSPLDTAHIQDMSDLFRGCDSLQSVDLSVLDMSHVSDLSGAFWSCRALPSLDLTGLRTLRVTSMGHMIQGCTSLEHVDLTGMDTSSLVNAEFLLCGCSALRAIDMSGLDFGHVRNMMGLFDGCTSLERVDLTDLDLSQVEDMTYLCQDCASLVEADLSGIDAPHLVSVGFLFAGCSTLRSIDLRTLSAPNLLYASKAFDGCTSLESFGIPKTWPLNEDCALPTPTATCGKWWSSTAGDWMSIAQIRQRGACADLFFCYENKA
ncbi:MAG: BspA family leucine-rich repeat surface protein [Atopobiaceae bacterium]|nr:BspA family leucine-rich repeat surface protein [Atopobiaceae bacterium]